MNTEQETLQLLADADQAMKAAEDAINALMDPHMKAFRMQLEIMNQLSDIRGQQTEAIYAGKLDALPELQKQDLILNAKLEVLLELNGGAQEQATSLIEKWERMQQLRAQIQGVNN